MSLNKVFQDAAKVAFTVFASIAKDGSYIVSGDDDGWGDGPSNKAVPMKAILVEHGEDAVKQSSFYNKVQPTDIVAMVKGTDLRSNNIRISTADTFSLALEDGTRTLNIEAYDTDPAEAIYLILLRGVKI